MQILLLFAFGRFLPANCNWNVNFISCLELIWCDVMWCDGCDRCAFRLCIQVLYTYIDWMNFPKKVDWSELKSLAWLMNELIDWSIDWSYGMLSKLIDWLIDRLLYWLTHWLTDKIMTLLIDKIKSEMTDLWLTDWLQSDWLIVWLQLIDFLNF